MSLRLERFAKDSEDWGYTRQGEAIEELAERFKQEGKELPEKEAGIDSLQDIGRAFVNAGHAPQGLVLRNLHRRWERDNALPYIPEIEKVVFYYKLDGKPVHRYRMHIDDREVLLTQRDAQLLHYFQSNPNRVISHDELTNAYWHGVPAGNMKMTIARLRVQIEEDPEHPKHLVTVRGYGLLYKEARNESLTQCDLPERKSNHFKETFFAGMRKMREIYRGGKRATHIAF